MSQWGFLNVDEILYRFHIWVGEPIIYVFSFRWLFDFGKSNFGGDGEGGFFGSLARVFYSRPSIKRDSIAEFDNPTDEQGLFEFLGGLFFGRGDHESVFSLLFSTFLGWFVIGAILLGLLWWFIKIKSNFLDHKEKIIYDTVISQKEKKEASDKSERWEKILKLAQSEDPSSWKLAVINADMLMADVLDDYGFSGATVSDQLHGAQKSGLTTLSYAYEAHKARNKIAHDADFELGKREAQTVITFFEKFFAELYHM